MQRSSQESGTQLGRCVTKRSERGGVAEESRSTMTYQSSWEFACRCQYTKACRSLHAYLNGRSHQRLNEILKQYKDDLSNASRILGSQKALAYARKKGLKRIQTIVDLLEEVDTSRALARTLIQVV